MPASLIKSDSLLAIDVGAVNTRAVLFDVVEDTYRFIAAGQALTSAEAPFTDIGEALRQAIEDIQMATGRILLDEGRNLITPTQSDGRGVDTVAATLSAGPSLKAAVVGLLPDASLGSIQRLAKTGYIRIVESLALGDHRKPETQIDSLIRNRPDLILVAGGVDGGASRSLQKLLNIVELACQMLPDDNRPALLYAGNQKLFDQINASLGKLAAPLRCSLNIRPAMENEHLELASKELAKLQIELQKKQLTGLEELEQWAEGHLRPSAYAEGRIIRSLSRIYGSSRGLLGVDIGASAASIAAGFNGKLTLGVYPQFGLGEHLPDLLKYISPEVITGWLALDISVEEVRDYLYEKSLHPASLPATKEELAISQAVARQALRLALQATRTDFPPDAHYLQRNLLPQFETILAAGSTLTKAPNRGQSLLLLLDALQPVGVASIILDCNNLLPMLGAAAERNSLLTTQVLESGAFCNLGTVASVITQASYGRPILRARLIYEDGQEVYTELKYGGLEILPLAASQSARLSLQPLHRADVGWGAGHGQVVRVNGGSLGVILDGRGRPLRLPNDPALRRELIQNWVSAVGG